jgi:hypothetical protein
MKVRTTADCGSIGDRTTWCDTAGACRVVAEDPLQRHACLEDKPELTQQQTGRERLPDSQKLHRRGGGILPKIR